MSISVNDNGCGVEPQNMERLFDPIYPEKSTGRGTGLAVVQGIVQLYHGALTVTSRVGMGSTFGVDLPVVKDNFSVVG